MTMDPRRPPKAFSLIELLASAVILSILAVMGVPYAQTAKDRQVELELKESLLKMRLAMDAYAYNEYPVETQYPKSIDVDTIRGEDGIGDPDGDGIADDDWDGQVDEDGAPLYPKGLDDLVKKGYLASLPRDPLSVDRTATSTWTLLFVNRRFKVRDKDGVITTQTVPGVVDVRSKAIGIGLSGTPFNSW
jgi:prepilin-type N-terminal cleavage/methylation domain-containing protein